MYHLIAAVVSVALGVYMTAAGVLYSGTVFTTASGKAQAMQIISSMEQIDAGWTMWENAGNNITTTLLTSALLTGGNYLAAYPAPPSIATASNTTGGAGVNPFYLLDEYGTNGNAAAATENSAVGISLVLSGTSGTNACLAIAQSAGYVAVGQTFNSVANPVLGGVTININNGAGTVVGVTS